MCQILHTLGLGTLMIMKHKSIRTQFLSPVSYPSSICMVFHCQWWWIKRAGSFLRTSFTLTVEPYQSLVFHSLASKIDKSLLVYVFMVDHSPSVCINHRKKTTYIYIYLRFETHESVWPLFTSSPFVGLVFCISSLPKLPITKQTLKCILLPVPLKGIQTWI